MRQNVEQVLVNVGHYRLPGEDVVEQVVAQLECAESQTVRGALESLPHA